MSHHPVAGYRQRPWELTVLGWFFALVPALSWATWIVGFALAGRSENPLEILALNFGTIGNGPWGLAHSLWMAALWVLFLVVAWGIFRVARWGFFWCIVSAAANVLFSMVLYGASDSGSGLREFVAFNPFQMGTLLNLVFFIPILVLLRQKIMAPFFNPRLKWWEQHPRVRALLRIEATVGGSSKTYQSFDISASGMFLGTGEVPPVAVGDRFPAEIHLEALGTEVDVVCRVVWVSDGTGRSPAGCGVTFEYPPGPSKKTLAKYIQSRIRDGHVLERT